RQDRRMGEARKRQRVKEPAVRSRAANPTISPLNGDFRRRGRFDRVEAGTVVPQDLSLVLVRQRQLEEGLGRGRIARIAMRVVGRVHEVIVPEKIDRVAGWYLVGLDRGHALPLE